jgi:hypothetical protein
MFNFAPDQYREGKLGWFASEAYASEVPDNVRRALPVLLAYWAGLIGQRLDPLIRAIQLPETGTWNPAVIAAEARRILRSAAEAEDGVFDPPRGGFVASGGTSCEPDFDEDGCCLVAPTELMLWWEGTWTKNRSVEVKLTFNQVGYKAWDVASCELAWKTGTDTRSEFLNIESLMQALDAAGCMFGAEVAPDMAATAAACD